MGRSWATVPPPPITSPPHPPITSSAAADSPPSPPLLQPITTSPPCLLQPLDKCTNTHTNEGERLSLSDREKSERERERQREERNRALRERDRRRRERPDQPRSQSSCPVISSPLLHVTSPPICATSLSPITKSLTTRSLVADAFPTASDPRCCSPSRRLSRLLLLSPPPIPSPLPGAVDVTASSAPHRCFFISYSRPSSPPCPSVHAISPLICAVAALAVVGTAPCRRVATVPNLVSAPATRCHLVIAAARSACRQCAAVVPSLLAVGTTTDPLHPVDIATIIPPPALLLLSTPFFVAINNSGLLFTRCHRYTDPRITLDDFEPST